MALAALLLLLPIAAAAAANSATPVRVESKAELRQILEDTSSAWLVYFHEGDAALLPPAGEDDPSEAAWFTKLCAVWPEVERGNIPWADRSMSPLRFAAVDKARLAGELAGEVFDSELSSVKSAVRLFDHGRDRGAASTRMDSRKAMHIVLQWADGLLSKEKEEL
ncbi:hypothetical protein AB1Y20_011797 [Prymnesium parvum]|uniref:Uncharacterized protein n=1 Tax=Prymnesium parvum TaxID=97485 RepID=A0AB34IIF7_PRYPA